MRRVLPALIERHLRLEGGIQFQGDRFVASRDGQGKDSEEKPGAHGWDGAVGVREYRIVTRAHTQSQGKNFRVSALVQHRTGVLNVCRLFGGYFLGQMGWRRAGPKDQGLCSRACSMALLWVLPIVFLARAVGSPNFIQRRSDEQITNFNCRKSKIRGANRKCDTAD
jgi:hypothetical protein